MDATRYKSRDGTYLEVRRYMGGRELAQDDLRNIVITRNKEVAAIVDRVVARVNEDVRKRQSISPYDIQA